MVCTRRLKNRESMGYNIENVYTISCLLVKFLFGNMEKTYLFMQVLGLGIRRKHYLIANGSSPMRIHLS